MVTLKRNSTVRAAVVSIFEILFFCFFISWFLLAPPGGGEKAWAGQLLFDGVPVDITTAANNNLVIAPGSGGYTQIGVANSTNSHATTNNDLFVTGSLETSSSAYLDSNVTLGSSTSNTITLKGYISSHAIPATTATYDLGSTSLYWRNAYIGTLYASTNAAVGTASPAATSILDLTSTTKGFLAPRMTTAQRDAITTPATGLFIYNTTNNAFDYFTGAAWAEITGGGGSGAAAYVTLAHDASLTADRILTGTANQITVTDNGALTTVVLSTPQNIATTSTPQFAGVKTGYVYPAADGAAAFQVRKADGATNVLDVDTTNTRVGIGTAAPVGTFDVNGDVLIHNQKSFAVVSGAGAADFNHSIYLDQTNNVMQFKEWTTFKWTNTSASTDLMSLDPTNGLKLLNNTSLVLDTGTGTYSQTYTGTATPVTITANSMTTGNGISISANGLSTGYGINIASTSTAADSYRLINLASSGAAAAGKNRYGLYSSLTGTGTGTNYGIYSTASGATTNYPGYFTGGPVLVTSGGTPTNATGNGDLYVSGKLEVGGTFYGGATSITGTTSHDFKINSGGDAAIASVTLGAAGTTEGEIIVPATKTLLIDASGSGIIPTIDINANTLDLATQAVGVTLNAAAANGLSFDTNTLSIDAKNHRVGIGTTAPGWLLDVFATTTGSITLRGTGNTYATTSQLNVVGHRGTDTAPTASLAGDVLGQIGFGYYKGGWKGQTAFMEGILNAAANGVDLALFTNTGDGTGTEQMRITSDGNVGIGQTTPTSILHTVASGAKVADYIGNRLTSTATSATAAVTKTGLSVESTGTWNGAGAINRGIYATATGGTTNYSGYFTGSPLIVTNTAPAPAQATSAGDLYVQGKLEVGGNIYGGATNLTGTTNTTFTINSGGSQLILSSTGLTANRTITFPDTTTTLAGLGTSQTFTGTNKINVNSTSALIVEQTGVHNNALTVDTTNGWVGINKTPGAALDVSGNIIAYSSSESQFFNNSGASSPYLFIQPKINGAVSYTRIGGWSASPASSATPLVLQPAGSNIGIGPIFDSGPLTPSYIISIDGQSGHTIGQERDQTAATAGQDLTLTAGGANSGGTNLASGNLYLKSGIATGSGYGVVIVQAVSAGQASGTTDRTPSTMATFGNTADLLLPAGTSTANTAPLKFTAGTNLTTAEAGAMEWNGTNLFITQTTGPTRKTIAYTDTVISHNLLSATHSDTTAGTVARGDLIVGQGASATWTRLAKGTAGQVLTGDGTDTKWSTPTLPVTSAPTSGKVMAGDGTNWVASTPTLPVTSAPTSGQLMIGNGTNFVAATLTGTSNQVTVTNGAGTITLSTPQDIATTSTPQFARIGMGQAADASIGIAFPDAQATRIDFGNNAVNAKWIGIDSGWFMAFADDTGFKFYKSNAGKSWANLKLQVDDWVHPYGYINFETDNQIIGMYYTSGANKTVNLGTTSGTGGVNVNLGVASGDKVTSAVMYAQAVGATNRAVYIDNSTPGLIGTIASSRRFKDNIVNIENISWMYALRPVNFTYKSDKTKSKQYGLIAEEVDEVNKSIVSYDKDGKPETVCYDRLIPVLLKSAQDQKKEIDRLKTEIDALKEQNELLKQTLSKIDLSSAKVREGERL